MSSLLQKIKNTLQADIRTNNILAEHEQLLGNKEKVEYFKGRRDYAQMILGAIINREENHED